MPDPLTSVSTRTTPQTERADERQVENSAGGYTFKVAPEARLHRFLTLGTDGGTYYTSEREHTAENAKVVIDWAKHRTSELVDHVVTISVAGRAPRQNPAIFALAAAHALGDQAGRVKARAAVAQVCRTGTHLFLFTQYAQQFRGWGRGLRRAVGDWYLGKPVDDVAYQAVKYRERNGWSHRDLLRKAHPVTTEDGRKALLDWITHGTQNSDMLPGIVQAFEQAQRATTVPEWVAVINEHQSVSWEMLPDAAMNEPKVWDALLHRGVPQTALMRQLPRLTKLGLLNAMTDTQSLVVAQLTDIERIRKARLHPVNVLIALRTYARGASMRGSNTWSPVGQIVDALDAAFYAAFGTLVPANKRTLLSLDVSGSMGSEISGLPISCREAAGALAMATAAVEPTYAVVGFTGGTMGWGRGNTQIEPLPVSPRQRLDDVVRTIYRHDFGTTDCALPMLWAAQNKIAVDTFAVYTDNETWSGRVHPHQALRQYREQTGIDARLVVVGMTATDFTIADPDDPGTLDVAGFDSAVPSMIRDFSAGDL